ncbi:MAG: stage III sporulation protein AF [Clostridia bacterium]|nr:stage III sporulation protein AF [Clostridia bacterium]
MQQYISTIIYICVFSVILQLILPDNKLKKYVGVLVSLIIILTLISPVIDVLKNDDVIAVISSTLDNIQSKVQVKEYDVPNLQNKIVLSATKEKLEEEIYTKCKEKFDLKFGINKVKIFLNEEYTIEDIDVYVKNLPEVAQAAEIIDYITSEYGIEAGAINVIREEE